MQPIRSANDTPEFRRNYGSNEFVNALYALDSGYAGKGVTVGVIDDGANTELPELAGQIDFALSKDFGSVTVDGVTSKRNKLGDENSDHGTPVAVIIAGRKDGQGVMGFAPEAKLAILRISNWNADIKEERLVHALAALKYAGEMNLKIVNVSLSHNGDSVWGSALADFSKTKGLVVISAGNNSGDDPVDGPLLNAANEKSVLFVVALSGAIMNYELASYSNKAGNMMLRTVTAPGTNVTVKVDGETGTFSGTSSAAPVVSGLAATIISKWPQLTGQQVGDVILNTAKDLGDAGPDPIYGMGLVDFRAALSPINPKLSNGATQTPLSASMMVVASALGTGPLESRLANVTLLDEFGRDFSGSIAGMVIRPEERRDHWMRRRVDQMVHGGGTVAGYGPVSGGITFASARFGPNGDDVTSFLTSGQIGYVLGSTGLRAGWNAQDSLQNDILGLAPFANGILSYAPVAGNSVGIDHYSRAGRFGITVNSGKANGIGASSLTLEWSKKRLNLRVSVIDEWGSVMGTPTGFGALRLGRGAKTAMLEAKQGFAIGSNWALEAYGSLGATWIKIDPASLITGAEALIASRVGFQAVGPALGGMVSLGLAQPLVVESGSAVVTHGSSYDLATQSLVFSDARANMAGERRLQLTAGYSKGSVRANYRAGLMHDVATGDVGILGGWQVRF